MDANCNEAIYFVSMMILSVLPSSVSTCKPDDFPRGSKRVALYKKQYFFYNKNSCVDWTVFVIQS